MVNWKKARKKPVVIQFREVIGEFEQVQTREGILKGFKGKDFIIKGVEGEVYPIAKQIFYKTYDVIE